MSNVTREIQIDAPAPRVWRHISDPGQRRRWLGGDLDVDLSPGEHGTFTGPDEDRPVRVDDVEEGRSVTFTWGADDGASRVRIEVEPDGDGSRVTVTETAAGAEETTARSTPDGPPVALVVPGRGHHHVPRDSPDPSADAVAGPSADPSADPRVGEVAGVPGGWAPGGWAPSAPLARAA